MTQAEPRFKKRLPCRVRAAGSSHSGMVLNLSRGGLFVQTSAGLPPGADVMVALDLANHPDALPIGAKVVWRRVVASHLRTLSQGGIGVRIETAPEAYYSYLLGVTGEAPAARPSADGEHAGPTPDMCSDSPKMAFRIRIKEAGGSRSRTLTLDCDSEGEARTRALTIAGPGWVILELERSF